MTSHIWSFLATRAADRQTPLFPFVGDIVVGSLQTSAQKLRSFRTGGFDFHGVHMQRGIHQFGSVNILAATTSCNPCPRTTQRLVRRHREHVALLKGEGVASLNEARDVSDVHNEDSITSSEMARNLLFGSQSASFDTWSFTETDIFNNFATLVFSTCSRVLSPVVATLP